MFSLAFLSWYHLIYTLNWFSDNEFPLSKQRNGNKIAGKWKRIILEIQPKSAILQIDFNIFLSEYSLFLQNSIFCFYYFAKWEKKNSSIYGLWMQPMIHTELIRFCLWNEVSRTKYVKIKCKCVWGSHTHIHTIERHTLWIHAQRNHMKNNMSPFNDTIAFRKQLLRCCVLTKHCKYYIINQIRILLFSHLTIENNYLFNF